MLDSESVFKLKVLVRIVGTKKRKTNFRATFLQKFIFVFAQVGLTFFFSRENTNFPNVRENSRKENI